MLTAESVKAHALALGFDVCGIAPAAALPELAVLPQWLERGYAGEMIYLHKSADARSDIGRVLPSARSVIVTGTVYNTDERLESSAEGAGQKADGTRPTTERTRASDAVRVARYARGDDYHLVLADRLDALVAWMRREHDGPFDAAIFVDKHHVQERVYARHAGVGWIGKNTCVINPALGSWLLLSGVAVSAPLAVDTPALDQCGACTQCIDACPTGALVDAHVIDATKCTAYLTIEKDGPIPESQRPWVGNHLFGCDICQDVCPWNLSAPETTDPVWRSAHRRDGVRASALWQHADTDLHLVVRGSAMTYLSLSGLRRNLALVIGNSGDPSLAAILDRPGRGIRNAAHSAETPVVVDAVAWAKSRLLTPNPDP